MRGIPDQHKKSKLLSERAPFPPLPLFPVVYPFWPFLDVARFVNFVPKPLIDFERLKLWEPYSQDPPLAAALFLKPEQQN